MPPWLPVLYRLDIRCQVFQMACTTHEILTYAAKLLAFICCYNVTNFQSCLQRGSKHCKGQDSESILSPVCGKYQHFVIKYWMIGCQGSSLYFSDPCPLVSPQLLLKHLTVQIFTILRQLHYWVNFRLRLRGSSRQIPISPTLRLVLSVIHLCAEVKGPTVNLLKINMSFMCLHAKVSIQLKAFVVPEDRPQTLWLQY